jgi:AraC-like DNA-binding protein
MRISSSADWDVLIAHVRRRSCDVAVVDPCIGGEHAAAHRLAELTAAVSATPGTPIVGYVSVTAGAIRATQLLARVDSSEIVIRGVDDTPDAFAATIHRAVAECSAIRFVARSRKLFERLPPGVARALAMAFHRPERARSVSQLASAANTTRRSLDRCLARAGLAPARTLLSCARANAAFHLIAAGSIRPSSAASLLGYASPRALSRELRALTGHVPSAIPEHLTHDLFAAALTRRLFR